jgi:hypothetical protein
MFSYIVHLRQIREFIKKLLKMEALNHHNPEYVTWKHEELNFALLGGIRIEGLHSMRVTLKVDFKTLPSIRHGLDLYNETQTEKLIKNIAERFTLSTTYIHTPPRFVSHEPCFKLVNTLPLAFKAVTLFNGNSSKEIIYSNK